ncbi:hypothetical protein JIN77_14805 [Verrucomicrobiaceae bacterium R5-34]|uniref:Uncharacterized protein n=1 Tax=Oceaniferula flava TaxID=2800421 RepID=A0AAE2S9Z6_9BACT|nr:hypothetical protein [Oceaniferula flavus]MBK1832004.1 hypothetical protein [Verrucomicrobiaceae bacterium R5-34]MBK1854101.1 hypothetical protein [Oceaniferula flavus]MBM1135407.1 hypothetical protein [Oceaniferula flavus]
MARPNKKLSFKGVAFHSLVVVITLIAAEAIGMLIVLPLMKKDPGYIVIAGLGVLPIWGSLLAIVYTADKRVRAILALVTLTIISGLILAIQ